MNKYTHKTLWFLIVIFPTVIELITSVIVILVYLSSVVISLLITLSIFIPPWIPIQLLSKVSILALILLIYFLLSWVDAVYQNFQYGKSVPKSLIFWHKQFWIYLKDIKSKLGWFKTCIILFVLTLFILGIWRFLSDPPVDLNQLSLIKDSLNGVQSQLNNITNSEKEINDAFFQNEQNYSKIYTKTQISKREINNLLSIPSSSNKENIDSSIQQANAKSSEIRQELINEMNKIGALMNSIKEKKTYLVSLSGKLNESNRDINLICSKEQKRKECLEIKNLYKDTEKSMLLNQNNLIKFFENKLLELNKNYQKVTKLRIEIALLDEKISNFKGKYLFDKNELQKDIRIARSFLKDSIKDIANFFNKNIAYKKQKEEIINNFNTNLSTVTEIKKFIEEIELKNTSSKNLISQTLSNRKKINKIIQNVNKIFADLTQQSSMILDDLNDLKNIKSNAYSHKYKFYLYKQQSQDKQFENADYDQIIEIFNECNKIHQEFNNLNKSFEETYFTLQSQELTLSGERGEFNSKIKTLKMKNEKIFKQAVISLIKNLIASVCIVIVPIVILKMWLDEQKKKQELEKQRQINASSEADLNNFIKIVSDPNESLTFKLYVIDKIENFPRPLEDSEIIELKNIITKLEQYKNTSIVIRKLTQVVESLEQRNTERRIF